MGRKLSEQERKQMSDSAKARWARSTPEDRQRQIDRLNTPDVIAKRTMTLRASMTPAMCAEKSAIWTVEKRQKASVASLSMWADPAQRNKAIRRTAEAISDPIVQQKRDAANKLNAQKPEFKAKISASQKSLWAEPAHRAKLTEARRRTAKDPVYIEKRREIATANWTPELARKMARGSQLANPSSLEIAVCKVLDALGVDYETQKCIGKYVVDIYLPSKNLVVECDGVYWHSLPGAKEKDARRDAVLIGLGYSVLRLPEADIKSGSASLLLRAAC